MSETSDQKTRKPKRSGYGLWVALIVVAFAISGLYWIISGVGRLSRSIVGGSSIGLSNSMELYELRFGTSAKDVTPLEAESLPRKEWILNIPRAYVVDTTGANGAHGPDESFLASLEIVLDPSLKTLAPLSKANKTSFPASSVRVKLMNEAFPSAISKVDYCVREDDYPDFLKKNGSKIWPRSQCLDFTRRCLVYANMDGWPVDIYLPKSVYFADPQPVCRAVEAFLDKHTTRRDSVK